jgi:succinyl-CoA synthetase beta subunit
MNLHEYQSEQLFAQYAIPIPQGEVAGSVDAAVAAAQKLGGSLWVVKALGSESRGRPLGARNRGLI